jgi:hypothetical protein
MASARTPTTIQPAQRFISPTSGTDGSEERKGETRNPRMHERALPGSGSTDKERCPRIATVAGPEHDWVGGRLRGTARHSRPEATRAPDVRRRHRRPAPSLLEQSRKGLWPTDLHDASRWDCSPTGIRASWLWVRYRPWPRRSRAPSWVRSRDASGFEPETLSRAGDQVVDRGEAAASDVVVREFEPVIWQSADRSSSPAVTIRSRRVGRGAPACRG